VCKGLLPSGCRFRRPLDDQVNGLTPLDDEISSQVGA
jgi:hypothetical protein